MSPSEHRLAAPPVGDARGDVRTDEELATALAADAARVLVGLRAQQWADAPALRDAGDRQAHEVLVDALARARPADSVLSEEAVDDPARLTAERVWIIDPLDGTREFGEAGRVDWAVHVALWERGELVVGAVALPALGLVLSSGDVAPAAPPAPVDRQRAVRVAVSRTRPPALLEALGELIPLELVPMGSAGFKVMAVARGEVDAYVHTGGQYEWDSAAPVAVARSRGLHTSRVDGSDLRYNQADLYLPDLVVCAAGLAPDLLAALRTVLESSR